MADCEHTCRHEQRIVKLSPEGQEFHGYSMDEIMYLLSSMAVAAGSSDAAHWRPEPVIETHQDGCLRLLSRTAQCICSPTGKGLDNASGGRFGGS